MNRLGLERCLRCHGVGNLWALPAQAPKTSTSPSRLTSRASIDLKNLLKILEEERRCLLFLAMDRATGWMDGELNSAPTAKAAWAFLAALGRACPIRIEDFHLERKGAP